MIKEYLSIIIMCIYDGTDDGTRPGKAFDVSRNCSVKWLAASCFQTKTVLSLQLQCKEKEKADLATEIIELCFLQSS